MDKTFQCCYCTFVSGSLTTLLQHGIGVDDDEILIYRERKLNEQTGDIVWNSKHTFIAITKKFLMDIKYILTKKMGCSSLNAPTSPMSTLMIIAIQLRDEQLHSLNKADTISQNI